MVPLGVLLENKTDIEKLFLEIHHDPTASRSPTEPREMPIHKVGPILYANATSLCSYVHIVFSVKKPSRMPEFTKRLRTRLLSR